jgi:hypothetical protein
MEDIPQGLDHQVVVLHLGKSGHGDGCDGAHPGDVDREGAAVRRIACLVEPALVLDPSSAEPAAQPYQQ